MNKNNTLKICHLGHKRIPSREGGIEIVVEELTTRMAALGHKVICYNRSGHHVSGKNFDTKKYKNYKGVQLKYVPTLNKKGLSAMTASVTAAICASLKNYDIVHFHAEGPSFMCWLPKLFGKKVIVTIHGLDWQRAKWGRFASAYIMLGEKAAVKWADEIIVLSKNVEKYFQETYKRDTHFIPNGVSRPNHQNANLITKHFGLIPDEYFLFLGRIVPEKGLHYLIDAFKDVKTDKKLVIAGGSSDTDNFISELKTLAKNDDRIIFTGFVQGRMLEELYSNAYVYALPSDLEGMPLSLLEAMSYGNCCLVSNIPECTEVIDNHAMCFKKSNVSDLKKCIQELCDTPQIVTQYKTSAADYICGKYNWDDVVKQTLDLYK